MDLVGEIRKKFSSSVCSDNGIWPIDAIDDGKTWIIRQNERYGVMIENKYDKEKIYETFSNVILKSLEISVKGTLKSGLVLTSSVEGLRNEFAVIAAQFVEHGKNNENRRLLETKPREWWTKWKELLGNVSSQKSPYDIIGELVTYRYLLSQKTKPLIWTGADKTTHDFETASDSYDVKSSLVRYNTEVSISSKFQLNSGDKKKYLVFCRMEKDIGGLCINDLVDELSLNFKLEKQSLNNILAKLGYVEGTGTRNDKYKILEMRLYKVDEKFPILHDEDFSNKEKLKNIVRMSYTINIENFDYIKIEA